MKPPQVSPTVCFIFSAESAKAPAFAKATVGSTIAFIYGLTPRSSAKVDKIPWVQTEKAAPP